ncbi:YqaJ viral recombinase family protein [Salinibacterium sp. SYSU T00001]|uniref:YqaJ viral recombinase family protein n=1 Tax=Homoserinimonas sedimenticola TaxID=2986805 RepID=UPI002236B5FA|nr:YqaJ viral recombinase family protein [Salinibacterium sedimenticola]MCW4385243.1 YqaJ viral recombinase family protein [Salinibacterium sedimenticola]
MLPLWDEPAPAAVTAPPHTTRILARSSDRVAWLRARSRGITATDVAKLATERSVRAVVDDKWHGSRFSGNPFTDHGRRREPEIAAWVQANFGIAPSDALFHAEASRVHLATPDGIAVTSARLELAEIKTTSSPWRSIPRGYLRQVWWQQYVLGAERTLLVWEQHRDFVPVDAEPCHRWIDRDDNEIHMLVQLADRVLSALAERADASRAARYGYGG